MADKCEGRGEFRVAGFEDEDEDERRTPNAKRRTPNAKRDAPG
jgi:hypothetical protein